MVTKTYKDLLFWQNSFDVAKMIIELCKNLPRTQEVFIIKNQILRSSMSVAANIAEGYGRFGPKEFSRYLQVSLGSANETECWLLLLKEIVPKASNEIDLIIKKNTSSIKMIAASLRTLHSH